MKQDIYESITAKIVAQLEQGVTPWHRPWNDGGRPGLPLRSNGIPYQGINTILLWCEAMDKGYSSPSWFTYKQAQAAGANVRKGERGSMVVYADKLVRQDDSGEDKIIPFLKAYTVFNVGQIDGLPDQFQPQPVATLDPERRIAVADAFFKATGADIRHGGNRCFYTPTNDFVQMAPFEQFERPERYYATLSHEVVGHWTGHQSRLGRNLTGKFGSSAYAVEEMVAEIAAAMTCAELGMEPDIRDHAAYLSVWIKLLKEQPRAIVGIASTAQKAGDYAKGLQVRQPEALPELGMAI